MKSLLIVGFPKGFTSAAWQIARRATGLRRPQVSAGEVLNPGRIRQSGRGWIREFLREHDPMSDGFFSRNPEFYPKARAVLDHFAEGGFCIKDVVQPFYVMQYLAEHPGRYNVVFCERPIEEVKERHRNAGWKYARDIESVHAAYSAYPTFQVHDALYDGNIIFNCLVKLGYEVSRFDYFTDRFIHKRDSLYDERRYRYA